MRKELPYLKHYKQNPSLVLEKLQSLKFQDRPIPELQSPYDVLVAVKFTGICGSDVSFQSVFEPRLFPRGNNYVSICNLCF
jgi:hypothetical protein